MDCRKGDKRKGSDKVNTSVAEHRQQIFSIVSNITDDTRLIGIINYIQGADPQGNSEDSSVAGIMDRNNIANYKLIKGINKELDIIHLYASYGYAAAVDFMEDSQKGGQVTKLLLAFRDGHATYDDYKRANEIITMTLDSIHEEQQRKERKTAHERT